MVWFVLPKRPDFSQVRYRAAAPSASPPPIRCSALGACSGSRTTVSLAVGGIGNTFVKLGMPVLALGLVALSGGGSGSRIALGVLGIEFGLIAGLTSAGGRPQRRGRGARPPGADVSGRQSISDRQPVLAPST